jgi:hypothetical protein
LVFVSKYDLVESIGTCRRNPASAKRFNVLWIVVTETGIWERHASSTKLSAVKCRSLLPNSSKPSATRVRVGCSPADNSLDFIRSATSVRPARDFLLEIDLNFFMRAAPAVSRKFATLDTRREMVQA